MFTGQIYTRAIWGGGINASWIMQRRKNTRAYKTYTLQMDTSCWQMNWLAVGQSSLWSEVLGGGLPYSSWGQYSGLWPLRDSQKNKITSKWKSQMQGLDDITECATKTRLLKLLFYHIERESTETNQTDIGLMNIWTLTGDYVKKKKKSGRIPCN